MPSTTDIRIDDPRVLALAQERQRLAHAQYGTQARWDRFTPDEQKLMLEEAHIWLRAAVSAGLVVA